MTRRSSPRAALPGPLLIVSPHVDDAALSCAALLARDEPVDVLNVFTGEPEPPRQGSWDAITGFRDSAEAAAARRAEEEQAFAGTPHRVEAVALLDLQYLDRPRTTAEADAIQEAIARWEKAAVHGTVALPAGAGRSRGRIRGRLQRVLAGAGQGEHPDHAFVRDAALAALATLPDMDVLLYEELPYLLGAEASRAARRAARRDGYRPQLVALRVDRVAKAARLAAYVSQIPYLCLDGRRLDDPANLPTEERYWRLQREVPNEA